MNKALVSSQLNSGWNLLKKLGIDGNRNYLPRYPDNPRALFKELDYLETWKECYQNQYYDFQLNDNSLIQFRFESYKPLIFSFVYYQSPFTTMTYKEFIVSHGFEYNSIGDSLTQEYEQYLDSSDIKAYTLPIRYDYDQKLYNPGRHPVAHFHFGIDNNIRIGTKKILKPISFLLFILRQCYPDDWTNFLTLKESPVLLRNVRDSLGEIEGCFWTHCDNNEMYLV